MLKYRTLTLLHPYMDDYTIWQRRTSLERYVEGLGIAVVMPDAYVSFYTDMMHGGNYSQFISEEVPAVARDLFPLSPERKDNFLAGASMGGYGAFKLALTYPERYAAAASLAGVVDICDLLTPHDDPGNVAWLAKMRNIFGDLSKVPGSQHDLFTLAQKVAEAPIKPRLYQSCGTEDFAYAANIRFRDAVRTMSLELTYEEGPGEHNWAYWDQAIQNALVWMLQ